MKVAETRTAKSLLNAKVGAACYLLSLLVSFFTRGIFLQYLGTEFLGFNDSLLSILGFLNIAEFGIAGAVNIVLYRPIFEHDRQQIAAIVSVLGYLYRCVGLFILIGGVVVSLFLPLIFPQTSFSWLTVYAGFYAYLFTSLLGYFVNYRAVLLGADQRGYIVKGYFQIAYTVKTVVQLIVAVYFCHYLLYFSIEVLFSIVYCLILSHQISQTYPWLQTQASSGRALLSSYPEVLTKVRQQMVHKVGSFVQTRSTPLFVYAFVSLPMVALYSNYLLVTGSLRTLMENVFGSTSASIGNLVASGDTSRSYSVYLELLSFRFFVTGILSGCLCLLTSDFISLWLGSAYLLPTAFFLLLVLQFFLMQERDVTDQFLYAYGLVQDVWSPVVESAVFILATVFFGMRWGLAGVMMGPVTSLLLVIYIWKPYFLFTQGFRYPLRRYLIPFLHYLTLTAGSIALTGIFLSQFFADGAAGWAHWVLKAFICFCIITALMAFL